MKKKIELWGIFVKPFGKDDLIGTCHTKPLMKKGYKIEIIDVEI